MWSRSTAEKDFIKFGMGEIQTRGGQYSGKQPSEEATAAAMLMIFSMQVIDSKMHIKRCSQHTISILANISDH